MAIRCFDFFLSLFGLLLFLPFFLIISLLIFIDSKGGIFYSQKRVGKDNVDFRLFKFRTMKIDSEKKGLLTVGAKDDRITKIGYYLRKYKLDELPQLINVFIGDMSLVGPRPEVRKYVNYYTPGQKRILSVKPGITDYASIEFINENELLANSLNPEAKYIEDIMPKKIQLNIKYIDNPSVIQYFYIIYLTLCKILK